MTSSTSFHYTLQIKVILPLKYFADQLNDYFDHQNLFIEQQHWSGTIDLQYRFLFLLVLNSAQSRLLEFMFSMRQMTFLRVYDLSPKASSPLPFRPIKFALCQFANHASSPTAVGSLMSS